MAAKKAPAKKVAVEKEAKKWGPPKRVRSVLMSPSFKLAPSEERMVTGVRVQGKTRKITIAKTKIGTMKPMTHVKMDRVKTLEKHDDHREVTISIVK